LKLSYYIVKNYCTVNYYEILELSNNSDGIYCTVNDRDKLPSPKNIVFSIDTVDFLHVYHSIMKLYLSIIFLAITEVPLYCTAQISWQQAYQKANAALSSLTLDEKVALGTGIGSGLCIGNTAPISKINWPGLCLQDSPLAVRMAYNVTGGIAGINTAATFDRNLALQRAREMGSEFRGKGINIQLGPDINLARVPEAGRNWEGFGEDPYLTGVMGRLAIQGVQDNGVVCELCHSCLDFNRNYHR
jgi:hypothetical protein